MGQPHKHAELIKAWADGAKIEQKSFEDEGWEEFDGFWSSDEEWDFRIKPEPKPDVVQFGFLVPCTSSIHWTSYKTSPDNLKLTFDGETGALKSAEVLK